MKRWLLAGWTLAVGCTRQADIYDEAETFVPPPLHSSGDVPSVPNLDLDDLPECSERPEGDCRGENDFPCGFSQHAQKVIETCFRSTGCSVDGWVSVSLGEEGCLSDIGMDVVEPAFVECLVDELGPIQCPCGETKHTTFLGVDNDGCRADSGPEG